MSPRRTHLGPVPRGVGLVSELLFDFDMLAALEDVRGYHSTNWSRAIPIKVRATNSEAARQQAVDVLGPRQGCRWVFRTNSIVSASITDPEVAR